MTRESPPGPGSGRSPLDPDRWGRVESVFSRALELPAEERHAFLTAACSGDEALRGEVESLLAAAGEPWGKRVAAVQGVARDLMASTGATAVGNRLGPYRLEEEIGRGGMGVVYRAKRVEGDFDQTVAVKVLPGALFSPERVERFRRERRILAGLEHPNIARILDGGTTTEGVPYVIMEYVEGVPLDEHAEEGSLDPSPPPDPGRALPGAYRPGAGCGPAGGGAGHPDPGVHVGALPGCRPVRLGESGHLGAGAAGTGTARLEQELAGQPEIQVQILTAVGDVYENRGSWTAPPPSSSGPWT